MNFDFPTVLVLATFLTGGIWGLDALFWAPKRRAAATAGAPGAPAAVKEPAIVEYSRSFFPVILAVLVLRSFVVEPFRIPSGSMMPTLLIGDFILVNKFSYGIRLPVLNSKIWETGEPERGDVVVFRYPRDPSVDYIKRVVGVPGDVIGYYDKHVYLNGKPVLQQYEGVYSAKGSGRVMNGAEHLTEQLAGVNHAILVRGGQPSVEGEFEVPPGHYFVMGDNRDNSNDSRFWGPVPEDHLVGKAFLIWMNWDTESPDGPVGWSRLGSSIQ